MELEVGEHADQGEEVVAGHAGVLLHLLVDALGHLLGQDLRQRGGAELLHAVVLDGAAGEVGVGLEGELVDGADEGREVLLVVGVLHHLLQLLQLARVHTPAPLQLVLVICHVYIRYFIILSVCTFPFSIIA